MRDTTKSKLSTFALAIATAIIVGGASVALAALNFSATGITGDGNVVIDSPGTISIGTSTATGVTIGSPSSTVSFPGNVTVGSAVLTTGPELVSNPHFSGGTSPTGWTLGSCATAAGGTVTFTHGVACTNVTTNVSLTAGQYYAASFTLTGITGTTFFNAYFDGQGGTEFYGDNWVATKPGVYTLVFQAVNTLVDTLELGPWNQSAGSWTITGVSIKAIPSPPNSPLYLANEVDGSSLFTAGLVNGNVSVGPWALAGNTTGYANTAYGLYALFSNTTGAGNLAFGAWALQNNTSGGTNTAIGDGALQFNTTGETNVAVGAALANNSIGSSNTAIGDGALYSNDTGSYQIAVGAYAGNKIADGSTPNTTSNHSQYLGDNTKAMADGDTNETVIGSGATGAGSNTITAGNSSVTDFYAGQGGVAKLHAGGGSANTVVCWKSDGKTLGYCSTQPDSSGSCTCN